MITLMFRIVLGLLVVSVTGAAAEVDEGDATPAALDSCFTAPGYEVMSVINDEHIYVRTRGGNHYLLTMKQCADLEHSYRVGTARLIPYGRTVCQNDGSYVLYDDGGRDSVCPILSIERVHDRAEAKLLATDQRPRVDVSPAPRITKP